MKSNKLNIFVCLTCGLIVVGFIFFSSDAKELQQNFHSLRFGWILAGVACMLLYWLLEALILHSMIKPLYPSQPFQKSFRVAMGGQYFNSITPFSTGGQPFQAYALTKQGLPLGIAMNGLLSKFILYQIALVVISSVLLSLRLTYFRQEVSNFSVVVLIGFFINLLVMLGLIGVALFHQATRRICRWIIGFLGKIKVLKSPEQKADYMDESLRQLSESFRQMFKNIPLMISGLLLSGVQLLCFMAVPFMVYRAFGLSEIDFLTIIAAHSFVMMVSAFIPVPGAGIGAEGFFHFFFCKFFTSESQLGLALILWRTITFYFTVFSGAFFAFGINPKTPRSEER